MTADLTELIGEYKIYQEMRGYRFTQDSVLLANLAEIKSGDKVIDLGSGCGVIGMLIAIKKAPSLVVCAEIDARASELCAKSAELNGLANKLSALTIDVRELCGNKFSGVFDKAVCNPPYYRNSPPIGTNPNKFGAKFENDAALDDFISAAARVLKFGGDFFIVHKADRLCDLLIYLRNNKLEPKKITAVLPKLGADADTVIVSAKKGGKTGLKLKNLIVANAEGEYTEEFKELYR